MKQFSIFVWAALCAMVLVACNTKSQSTPIIQSASVLYRATPDGVHDTISITDTLNVGDTLRLNLLLNGYFNCLRSFYVRSNASEVNVALELPAEADPCLATGTDLENAQVVFVEDKLYLCPATMRFIPLKSGKPHLELVLASDADEPYSPRTYTYEPVVR